MKEPKIISLIIPYTTGAGLHYYIFTTVLKCDRAPSPTFSTAANVTHLATASADIWQVMTRQQAAQT